MNQNQLKKKRPRQKYLKKIQKPLWIELNKNDFNALIKDVYNNLDRNELETIIDRKTYDLKNAKRFLVKSPKKKSCLFLSERPGKIFFSMMRPVIFFETASELNNIKRKKRTEKKKKKKIT